MSSSEERAPGRPILIGVAVLVGVAIVVALAMSRSDVRTYEPGTPEAIGQAYIQALFDNDRDTAHGYLSPSLQSRCEPRDLDVWWVRDAESASFDEVRIEGDKAEIEVRLVSRDYELEIFPFDNYEYARETELVLERLDDDWVIVDATWPLAGCTWR